METWMFNNEIISKHSIFSTSPSTLQDVSNRDYPGENYFSSYKEKILCIDMDTYEKDFSEKPSPEPTVDAVIGINDIDNKNNSRLLLIELRMGYKDAGNLERKNLIRKIQNTKNNLGSEIAIERKSLFIFNDMAFPKAKFLFNRWSKEKSGEHNNIIPFNINNFKDIIKSQADIPYKPLHDFGDINKNLVMFMKDGNWEKYMKEIKYLIEEAYKCKSKYQLEEFKLLKDFVKKIWKDLRTSYPSFKDDDLELQAEVFDDDIENL